MLTVTSIRHQYWRVGRYFSKFLAVEKEIQATIQNDTKFLQQENIQDKLHLQIPKQHILAKDMNEYLTICGYDTKHPILFRSLSSLFTYPLTLSYGLQSMNLSTSTTTKNILILGARAESSLPASNWRHLLISSTILQQVNLYFQGPHIYPLQHQCIDWNHDEIVKKISFMNLGKCLFHSDEQAQALLPSLDLVVLFNPGFGHDYLKSSWNPSLSQLLQMKIPILATALSEYDLQRDINYLKNENTAPIRFLLEPTENPFRSHREAIDDKEQNTENRVIVTNAYVYTFKGE